MIDNNSHDKSETNKTVSLFCGHTHYWHVEQIVDGFSLKTCDCGCNRYCAGIDVTDEVRHLVSRMNYGELDLIDEIIDLIINGRVIIDQRSVPPKPQNIRLRKQYYDDNRQSIIADTDELGRKRTMEKWDIGNATWGHLMDRWDMPKRKYNRRYNKKWK